MSDEKQTKTYMAHLDNTLSGLWNASIEMDKVAEDCKVNKGEPLIDRILTCEKALEVWDNRLNALDWDLSQLKELTAGFKDKSPGSIASIGQGVYDTSMLKAKEMKALKAKYAAEFAKHKETLRKIKA